MSLIALDTETTGLDLQHGCKPFFVSTYCKENGVKNWEFPVDPFTRQPEVTQDQKEEIADYLSENTIVFHHAKFDIRALSTIGIFLTFRSHHIKHLLAPGPGAIAVCQEYHDTLLGHHVIDSGGPHGLKYLSKEYLKQRDSDESKLKRLVRKARLEAKKRGWNLGTTLTGTAAVEYDYWLPAATGIDKNALARYATIDVEKRTYPLWDFVSDMLTEKDLWPQYERQRKFMPVLYQMESNGLYLRPQEFQDTSQHFTQQKNKWERKAVRKSKININSSIQLREYLYEELDCPIINITDKGSPQTNKDTLLALLDHPETSSQAKRFIRFLVGHENSDGEYAPRYKDYVSALRYLKSYDQHALNHYLYPSFNQTGTKLTRLSSSHPNGQNIGKREAGLSLRQVFGPPKGKVWYALDYNQLELRIFAQLSQEESLIEAFRQNHDFHGHVARRIFGKEEISTQERRIAKNTNFAIIFGGSDRRVNETAGIPNAAQLFRKQFPSVARFIKESSAQVREHGCVYSEAGYRLEVDPKMPYKGANARVQGTAGDVCKNAMQYIYDADILTLGKRKTPGKMILQVHDEIIFQFDAHINHHDIVIKCKALMEQAGSDLGIETPVSIDLITTTWDEGTEVVV